MKFKQRRQKIVNFGVEETEIQGMLVKWKLVGKREWVRRKGEPLTGRQVVSKNGNECQVFTDKHALTFQIGKESLTPPLGSSRLQLDVPTNCSPSITAKISNIQTTDSKQIK